MLTSRAWWFLLTLLLILTVGLLTPSLPLMLVGLTLLMWFGGQWLLFLVRLPSVRRLRVEREVWDEKTAVATLWAGQTFEVRVRVTADWSSPPVAATDRVPFAVEYRDGLVGGQGTLGLGRPLEYSYRIQCGTAGVARFEGVRVEAADSQGFFYHVHFAHAVVVMPILPMLAHRSGQPASKKRHNQLMPPGIHRFRRPGSGSELLDLRDYLPGDPPKTIAWKVSARRDRLITKEFESEVPVRCTLFVDTSNSVRVLGRADETEDGPRRPYRKALDRLVDLAAGILQASASIRDLTGLCLFDEQGVTSVRPNRGGAHVTECLRRLAESSALMPRLERANPQHLLALAYSFVQEVYPELLRPAVNAVPFRMTWLDGFSGYSRRRFRDLLEILHRRKSELRTLCWWSSFWAMFLPLFLLLVRLMFKLRIADRFLVSLLFFCPLASFLLWGGTVGLFALDALTGWSKRRRDRWRKQLAAILSARYGLAPGGLAALLEDDDAFVLLLQQFLNEHQVPYSLPLYGPDGRYLFAAPEKVPVLAKALLRAVGKGRDNELFVLLVDLLELDDYLEPILRAVGVALGRHHQVILLCPWPPGLAPPPSSRIAKTNDPPSAIHDWDQLTTQRFHLAYQRLRRAFTRLGVVVLCAASEEPVPLILRRLEQLRTPGRPL